MQITCCNKPIEIQSGKDNGKTLFYAICPICNKKYKSEKKEDVERYFQNQNMSLTLAKIPNKPADIIKWGSDNLPALMKESAQFIDKPATRRMIEKNLRYISNLSGKSWDKIWSTQEGQESISYALSESLYHAAILPEMGSIVPFGSSVAEFIPGVECYKFALEQGNNAPFGDIQIDLIHENDKTDNYQKDGDFFIEIKRGIPRGEIIAVVVSAVRNDTGKRIGDIFDTERLLAKAEQHSPAYRNYLKEKAEFKRMQVEGQLKADSEGQYFIKKIEYTKDGKKQSFDKKIYESDITNPYDGPDRPEMLRKSAGKSFFRPYMKVRNAAAMAEEWQNEQIETREQAADQVLNRAAEQFDFPENTEKKEPENENIQDAEIVEPDETPAGAAGNGNLFDEEGL